MQKVRPCSLARAAPGSVVWALSLGRSEFKSPFCWLILGTFLSLCSPVCKMGRVTGHQQPPGKIAVLNDVTL